MCGRYVQTKKAREHARKLAAMRAEAAAPRPETWNLCPSTLSLVVRSREGIVSADWLSWGIQNEVPLPGFRPINARIESVDSKPTFRDAWQHRRGVVPVDGWYEWKTQGKTKQPYYFFRRDGLPIFFGGLWTGDTFCLLTTEANGDLAQIHDRRPLSLRDEEAGSWISTPPASPERVVSCAILPGDIAFHPVSPRVSSPRHDGPELTQAVSVDKPPEAVQTNLFLG